MINLFLTHIFRAKEGKSLWKADKLWSLLSVVHHIITLAFNDVITEHRQCHIMPLFSIKQVTGLNIALYIVN